MNTNNIKGCIFLFFLFFISLTQKQVFAQSLISGPSTSLTGVPFSVQIVIQGNLPANCNRTISFTTSSNLTLVNNSGIPSIMPGNQAFSFNVNYQFPGGITCNGTIGNITVTVNSSCGGTPQTGTMNITARAFNTWTLSKVFVAGNMTCGQSQWRIIAKQNNPNPPGAGAYNLSGTITETTSLPIISGSTINVNMNHAAPNNDWILGTVILQNCASEGSILTNTANVNLTLGNGCGNITQAINANSGPLVSPNASISFSKGVQSSNYATGCGGRYRITIINNGNVPWTNLVVSDNLTIPGISVTGIVLPSGWISTPTIPPYSGNIQFSSPAGFVLNPNGQVNILINFDITGPANSTVSNTAYLDYQASGTTSSGGGGAGTSVCPGITCPTIGSTVQNKIASNSFQIEEPKAVPTVKKCLVNPPANDIYQIGDNIRFRILVGNSGSANLNTTLNDALDGIQNLQIIPSTITYLYETNVNYSSPYCLSPSANSIPPPFSIIPNISNLQNPSWQIVNMPGTCQLYKANILFIEFEAVILPQTHGTKTNTARMGTLQSPVNYTVNMKGSLAVSKTSSQTYAEEGQAFDFIITVTNNGTVPLNKVTITDKFPVCAIINGQPKVQKGGSVISYTHSGNTIIINPSALLQPGESFTITVPFKKSGSGICCNESVQATANMTIGNISLIANYGSAQNPAACIINTLCCDIPDFKVVDFFTMTINGNIVPGFHINGGPLPIQEVEISLVDYHVKYNNKNCIPANMGDLFGHIYPFQGLDGTIYWNFNQIPGIGGSPFLSVQHPINPVNNSITWSLTTNPLLINMSGPQFSGAVAFNFIPPSIINLECCSGEVFYCFKVRIKDVNCNVCEKIVCGSFKIPKKIDSRLPVDQYQPAQKSKVPQNPPVEDLLEHFRINPDQRIETEIMRK